MSEIPDPRSVKEIVPSTSLGPDLVTDEMMDQAANELGLLKLKSSTVQALRRVGLYFEGKGIHYIQAARAMTTISDLDTILESAKSAVEEAEDSDQKANAIKAYVAVCAEKNRTMDLVDRMLRSKVFRSPADGPTKFQGLAPGQSIIFNVGSGTKEVPVVECNPADES